MGIETKLNLTDLDWNALADVYERAPLGTRDPEKLKRAFESSFLTSLSRR